MRMKEIEFRVALENLLEAHGAELEAEGGDEWPEVVVRMGGEQFKL